MTTKDNRSMIAVCGLDCGACGILLASDNPQMAERLAKNFREQGIIPDATPDMFRCDGCRGDRARHWSANCFMLKCCIDDKSLEFCNQCPDFPCSQLEEWATKNEKHKEALVRLKSM